jgi:hypothetical protein
MYIKPQSDLTEKMTPATNDPLGFLNNESSGLQNNPQTDLIQLLLYEIIRVKDLIKYYESIPNGGGQLGASILNELVSEAYDSLVNYDIILMKKYYDLLQNCD